MQFVVYYFKKFEMYCLCLSCHVQHGRTDSVWQETITITNGGQPLSGPKVLPDGDLLLEYVDGQMCIDDDNISKPFSVSIVLQCAADSSEVCICTVFI